MKKERGITLIALVITIAVILILAGIGIYFATTGLLAKAKYSKFINEMAKVKENITIRNLEDMLTSKTSSFLKEISQEEWYSLDSSIRNEIAFNREKTEGIVGDKLPTNEYYKDITWETQKDEVENDTGKIKDIFYIDKELTTKEEKAYLYDKQSEDVYRIEPEIIDGVPVHSNGLGNILIGNSGLLRTDKRK